MNQNDVAYTLYTAADAMRQNRDDIEELPNFWLSIEEPEAGSNFFLLTTQQGQTFKVIVETA